VLARGRLGGGPRAGAWGLGGSIGQSFCWVQVMDLWSTLGDE
jgi:hypothetical protein